MADSSTGSSRTRLFLFVAVAAVVAGYFLLSPRTENDSDTTPATTRSDVDVAKPGGASTAPSGAPDSMPVPGPESARGADGNDTAGAAPQKRRQSADETGGQALDEARIAIATEPDRKATEAFRARVAAPPPATPEWVVEAIENGPPPVPVEIQEQIALGRPEVPVEMQEAIERTLRDGATPPPPEIQRAIEEAQQR